MTTASVEGLMVHLWKNIFKMKKKKETFLQKTDHKILNCGLIRPNDKFKVDTKVHKEDN